MSARDILIGLLVMIIWSGNFAVAKLGLEQLPPLTFLTARFAVVALLLVPFVRFPREKAWRVLGYAVTLGGVHFGIMFVALSKIDAATAALASQTGVPFAVILSALFFRDYPGIWRLMGILIAFAGVAVIAGEPRFEGGLVPLFMVVIAAFAWAFGAIQTKAMGRINGFALNGYMALFSVPQLALLSFFLEDGQVAALLAIDVVGVFSVLYQSVLVVIVGYGLWYCLLERYPVSVTMPFTLLMPFFGVLAGVLVLGETVTSAMIAGGALTIFGVAVIIFRTGKREKKQNPPI